MINVREIENLRARFKDQDPNTDPLNDKDQTLFIVLLLEAYDEMYTSLMHINVASRVPFEGEVQ